LIALDVPPSGGGDTVFASSVVGYNRLSEEFRKRLSGLKVYHDGLRLENPAREAGSVVRYKPVSSVHPLVRTHPVSPFNHCIVSPFFVSLLLPFVTVIDDRQLERSRSS
jgi:sulfonate dioxygenase